MNASPVDPLGASFAECPLHDSDDIQEVALLLQSGDMRALIDAARQQGLTAAALARRLIGDYLRQRRSA